MRDKKDLMKEARKNRIANNITLIVGIMIRIPMIVIGIIILKTFYEIHIGWSHSMCVLMKVYLWYAIIVLCTETLEFSSKRVLSYLKIRELEKSLIDGLYDFKKQIEEQIR